MKKIFKLLLPLFLIFIAVDVNAEDLVCNNGDTISITETSKASPFGFDTYLPVCEWKKVIPEKMVSFGTSTSVDALLNAAKQGYDQATIGTDEKSVGSVRVGICKVESNVKVEAKCSYTATVDASGGELLYHAGGVETGACNSYKAIGPSCGRANYYCNKGKRDGAKCLIDGSASAEIISGITADEARAYEGMSRDEILSYVKGQIKYSNYKINSCEVLFSLQCPLYKCDVKKERINACTPTFKTEDGETAYCVNPNQPFSKTGHRSSEYIDDPNFDVNNCESSYSTVDCGYANILIEAGYANRDGKEHVCDNAINFALRLWGVHTDQAGYTLTGLSRVTGAKCDQEALFIEYNGKVYNVYRETHNYIMEHFLEKAKTFDYIRPTGDHFEKITCSANLLGVACAPEDDTKCGVDHQSTYQTAFDLYFNTLIGNKFMKEHLREMFNGDVNTAPSDATIEEEKGETIVEVKFETISKMVKEDNVIDCDKLKPGDKNYDEIMPFCQVRVSIVDSEGNIILDSNGNPLDDLKIQECIKGDGCRIKITKLAICDIIEQTNSEVVIRTKYKTSVSKKSIKKLIPCEDPEANQYMFSFYDLDAIEKVDNLEPISSETITSTSDFPITSVNCGNSGCRDFGVREDKNQCTKDSEYNKKYSHSVKDPSLSCIVNMPPSAEKNTYDYTEYYGLNPNICRVYCSDEVTYTMPTKKLINSGLSFKYNIEFNEISNPEPNVLLSNVVTEKRRCVSEIYYSTNFPDSSVTAIKKKYGLTDEESKKAKNWTLLFQVLSEKAKKEGERKENLNELIYDLYNCNFYSKTLPAGVSKPKNKVIGITSGEGAAKFNLAYDFIKYLHNSKNLYGIGKSLVINGSTKRFDNKCDLTNDKNTCVNLNGVYYTGGAEVYGKVGTSEETTTRVGKEGNNEPIDFESIVSGYNIDKNGIKYCSGSNCLTYAGLEHEKYTVDNFNTEFKTSTISKAVTENKMTSFDSITIPANDYAYFDLTTEVGFYNNSKYEVHPYTGYVSLADENSNLIKLDDYIYPMAKDAYSMCSGGAGEVHQCNIKHVFGDIKTYYRNNNIDRLTTALSQTQNRTFGCFIDVKPPEVTECTGKCSNNGALDTFSMYRNADLNNLFPSEREGKSSNWTTQRGFDVRKAIKESANSISTNQDDYLEYSIDLTPEQIRYYKSEDNNGYQNNTIDESSCQRDGDVYINCKSVFLNGIRTDAKEGTSNYGNFKPEYSTGESKHSREDEN